VSEWVGAGERERKEGRKEGRKGVSGCVCAGERKRREKKRYRLISETKELLEMLLNLKTFSLLAARIIVF
jgi:NhaP-type Na+/H+ or K+/H+ antiporter